MRKLTIINISNHDDNVVDEIVRFVYDRRQVLPISGALALRVNARTGGGGYACDRLSHSFPKWAGRARYAVGVSASRRVGQATICGHAKSARRTPAEDYNVLYERGVRRVGRWPLYRVETREECLVHIVAHEIRHVVQFDNDRSLSEVDCELFAEQVLDEWRAR